jgi:hypothetical protein
MKWSFSLMNFMSMMGNVLWVKTLFTQEWSGVPDVHFPQLEEHFRIM